jgi:integrase
VNRNVVSEQSVPKVADDEMVIVQDVPALVDKLDGFRLRVPAMVALFTGLRLSEILALRWNRVDVDAKVIQVREALEQTRAHGIRFKSAKTRAGRRDITLPDILIEALREHRKRQLELRMQLGAGRLPDDALLFATVEGEPLSPNAQSAAWADFADGIGMPDVTFHALRHTHASQLIDAGPSASALAMPSRTSPCASMRICSGRTMARRQRPSMLRSSANATAEVAIATVRVAIGWQLSTFVLLARLLKH